MQCPSCHAANPEQNTFCHACGTKLVKTQDEQTKAYYTSPQSTADTPPKTNGLAIASLVLGLLGFLIGFITLMIPSILAIIFGHIARSQIKHANGQQTGGGLALAGLITGYIIMSFFLIGIIAAIALPAYMDYSTRAQLSAIEQQLSTQVASYASTHAKLPGKTTNFALNLTPELNALVDSVTIDDNGRITVLFKGSHLKGQDIVYEPIDATTTDVLRWRCTGGNLSMRLRRALCRP